MSTTATATRTDHSTAERSSTATTRPGAWRTPDWINVVLGVIMVSAPLWMPGAQPAWQIPLGMAIIVVALWGLASNSSLHAQKTMCFVSALVFLSPFAGTFGTPAATWLAWVSGAALFIISMYAINVRTLRGW